MKYNYWVARRVYASTYANMAEQFKIYLNFIPPDEIDEIENDFRVNGNVLLSIRQTESAVELFDSFAMFYFINGRLPYRGGHLFVPDGETPAGIIGEKLSPKELFCKIFQDRFKRSRVIPISCYPAAIFCRKRNPSQFPMPHRKQKMPLMIGRQLPILPQEGKVKMKLTKKYIRNQNLKLQLRLKNKLQRDKKKLSKVNWNKTMLIFKFQENLILKKFRTFLTRSKKKNH